MAQQQTSAGTSSLMQFLETKVLKWAVASILVGAAVRTVAVALSSSVPYEQWPWWLRLPIEVVVALGMVGGCDVVFNVASSRAKVIGREIDALRNSDDYVPNPRLAPDRFRQQKELLDARLARALAGKQREQREQLAIAFICGAIMLIYGGLFEVVTFGKTSWVGVVAGIVGVGALLPIQYFVSALFHESRKGVDQLAEEIIDEGMTGRLAKVRDRVIAGEETPEDIGLMDKAVGHSPFHKAILQSLRRPVADVEYLTGADLYAWFDVRDASGQAQMRRIVRDAGKAGKHGVIWDDASGRWKTPKAALPYLFPPQVVERLRANTKRTMHQPRGKPRAAQAEPGSNVARTLPERPEEAARTSESLAPASTDPAQLVLALDMTAARRGEGAADYQPTTQTV